MSIKLLVAPPAGGKTQFCINRIQEFRAKDPFTQIYVIVSDKMQMAYWKKTLASTHGEKNTAGFIGTKIISFSGLSMEILGKTSDAPHLIPSHLDAAIVRQVIQQALISGSLHYFGPIAERPGVAEVLADTIRELQRGCITPEKLMSAALNDPKTLDTATVYRLYLDFLKENGWIGSSGLLGAAAEIINRNPSVLPHAPLLVVDGFDMLTKDCIHLLQAAAKCFEEIIITLPGNTGTGRTADERLAANVNTVKCSLCAEIIPFQAFKSKHIGCMLAGSVLSGVSVSLPVEKENEFFMLSEISQSVESREVLRQVKNYLVKHGLRGGDCAIFVPDMQTYAPILRRAGQEMGVPLYFAEHQPLSAAPAAAVLLRLLRLPLDDFPTTEVLAVLRSPFLSGNPDPADETDDGFERDLYIVDQAGIGQNVISGLVQWREAFYVLEKEAEKSDKTVDEEQTKDLPSADKIRKIAESFNLFADILNPPTGTLSRRKWADRLNEMLEKMRYYEKVEGGQNFRNTLGTVLKRMAFSEEKLLLSSLNYVDFVNELEKELQASVLVFQGNINDHVFVSDIKSACGFRQKLTVLMGFSEGLFPRGEKESLVLSPDLRKKLELPGGADQSINLLHALTRSDQTLVISRPNKTDKGEEWPASIYWQSIIDTLMPDGDENKLNEEEKISVLKTNGVIRQPTAAPASIDELAFEIAMNKNSRSETLDQNQKDQLNLLLETASRSLDRMKLIEAGYYGPNPDTELKAALVDPILDSRPTSCSVIETFLNCPFRYFLSKKLKLEMQELKGTGMDAAQLGTLNHLVMELTFSPGTVYDSVDAALEKAKSVIPKVLSSAPSEFGFRQSELWEYEKPKLEQKLLDSIEAMFKDKKLLMNSQWKSLGTEVRFGYPSAGEDHADPLIVETEHGTLKIRGVIDRLDIREDGKLRVVDYKTGSSGFAKKDLEHGSHIQAGIYAAAAVQALRKGVNAESAYWMINSRKTHLSDSYSLDDESVPNIEFLDQFAEGINEAKFPAVQKQTACPDYCPASAWCRNNVKKEKYG